MKWALVSTKTMPHEKWFHDSLEGAAEYRRYLAENGTIMELIEYDGKAPYTPPEGMRLTQVPDDAHRGDTGYY